MKYFLFLPLILYTTASCLVQTSNSFDGDVPGLDVSSFSAEFSAARDVLIENCVNCHSGEHSAWGSWDENNFISSGQIVGGSVEDSQIYYRLKGTEENPTANKDMPEDAAELDPSDISTIAIWINSAS